MYLIAVTLMQEIFPDIHHVDIKEHFFNISATLTMAPATMLQHAHAHGIRRLTRHSRRTRCIKRAQLGRTVAAAYFFRVTDYGNSCSKGSNSFDGIVTGELDEQLCRIRSMKFDDKHVSILTVGVDAATPCWSDVMRLKDAFLERGATEVDYVYFDSQI